MSGNRKPSVGVILSLFVLSAVTSSCSLTQQEESALAADSMRNTRGEVQNVIEQIDVTLAALNDIAQNPQANLKPQFEKFSKAVDGLEARAEQTKQRATDMREKGTTYFANWGQNPDVPIDPDLKTGFDKIAQAAADARDAFEPFLASLADVEKLLRMDLSGTGVGLIQDLVKKANSEAGGVKDRLKVAVDELDRVANLLDLPAPE